MDWIHQAQDVKKLQYIVDMVMHLPFPLYVEKFLSS
jgi:hypothetical protein